MSQAGGDAVLAAGAPAADTHPNPQPAHSAEMGSNAHTPAAENGSLSPSSPQQPQHHLPETPLQANPERKRKSRWGIQVEDSQATAAALAAQPQQPQPTDGDGEAGDGEPRKRSRFSSRTASPAPPAFPGMVPAAPNIPGLVPGLPGMPPGMPLGMPGMPGMPGFPGPPPGMPGMLPPGGVAAGGPPPGPPPTPFGLTPGSPEFKEMQEIQKKLEKVNLRMARLEMGVTEDPENPGDRSPSPEPTYDANGVRTNTRIQRYRSRFLKERTELLERLMSLNPAFAGAMPKTQKQFSKKIWVPQEEYPDRNFRGLIIGPRGNTHRRMEEETGCKISIRGKGAHSKNSVRPQPGDDEPMHVLVTAENEEDFQKGIAVIEKLLMPNNEEADQHKARQLRELAAINGTIRRVVCHVCGAEGHTIATCPDRTGAKWTAANVLCNICGSTSHIDQDCPTRQNLKPGEALPNIHMEYANFMAELTGEAPPGGFLTDGTGGPRLALTMAEGAGGGGGHQSGLEAGGAPREMLGAPGPSDAPPPPPPHDHGRSHPHNHPHSHSHPHPLSHSHSPSYHAQREHIGGGAPPQRELIGASSLAPREYAGPGGHVHGHHPGPAREFIGGPPPPPSQPQYAPAPREMMGGHHGHREFIGGAPPQLPQAHQQHQQHQQHPSNGGGPVRELIGASPAAPPVGPPPPPPHAPYDPYAGYGYAAPPQGSYPGYPPQDQSAYYAPPPPPPPGLPYPGHHDPYGYGGNPPADAYAGYASQGDPYGQSGVAYGQLADAYGQQASAYGQPAETYGQPADSYGQHAAAYGQQGPPGYHAVPPPGHYGSDPQQPPPQ